MNYQRWLPLGFIALLMMGMWGAGGLVQQGLVESGKQHMEWVCSEGEWFCFRDGEVVRNSWVDKDTYYVDEKGSMVTDEWVCELAGRPGEYIHSYEIREKDFPGLDIGKFSYVGYDGRRLRNKIIYRTPFRFDGKGYCRLTEDDISAFAKTEHYGFEGGILTIHSSRKDVQEMSSWPEEGCVKKIDDIIVCKMGE